MANPHQWKGRSRWAPLSNDWMPGSTLGILLTYLCFLTHQHSSTSGISVSKQHLLRWHFPSLAMEPTLVCDLGAKVLWNTFSLKSVITSCIIPASCAFCSCHPCRPWCSRAQHFCQPHWAWQSGHGEHQPCWDQTANTRKMPICCVQSQKHQGFLFCCKPQLILTGELTHSRHLLSGYMPSRN